MRPLSGVRRSLTPPPGQRATRAGERDTCNRPPQNDPQQNPASGVHTSSRIRTPGHRRGRARTKTPACQIQYWMMPRQGADVGGSAATQRWRCGSVEGRVEMGLVLWRVERGRSNVVVRVSRPRCSEAEISRHESEFEEGGRTRASILCVLSCPVLSTPRQITIGESYTENGS